MVTHWELIHNDVTLAYLIECPDDPYGCWVQQIEAFESGPRRYNDLGHAKHETVSMLRVRGIDVNGATWHSRPARRVRGIGMLIDLFRRIDWVEGDQ